MLSGPITSSLPPAACMCAGRRTAPPALVTIVDAYKINDEAAAAVAEVWQTVNGALRVKLHDKHAALVSIGKHLGMFHLRT